ncbi:MAG: hypothetical protein ACE5KM_19835 [Planctomycetaceae bacterium]
MDFTLEPIWPLPWVVLAILGLLAFVLLTYPQRVRHLRPWDRRLLVGLRLFAVALIAVAMLRPVVLVRKSDSEIRYLYIVADSSRSMKVPDGAGPTGGNTRRAELLKTLESAKAPLAKLEKDVEIRYFDFAARLESTETLEDKTDGLETDLAGALQALLRETDGKSVLGVILLSDGAPRVAESVAGVNQRQLAVNVARDFGERGIKVHTVPFGGAGVSGSAADLALLNVTVDPNPYEGKLVAVNATVQAVGAKGQRLTARILVENRTGVFPGQAGKMVEAPPIKTSRPKNDNIVPDGREDVLNRELTFVLTRPGIYKIAVEISGLRNERNTQNNTLTRIIHVRSGGVSVAYFDRIRPEQKYIRRVNASDKIQLDYFPTNRLGRGGRIDPKVFESGENAYDVFILGDVAAAKFGWDNLKLLKARVDDGAGLLMIGGFNSFGAGGYGDPRSAIKDLLPVELNPRDEFLRRDELKPAELHHPAPVRMVPTERGLRRIVMRIATDGKHRELWKKLSPMEGANRLKRRKTAGGAGEDLIEVLATTQTGAPLLIAHEAGKGRDGKARLARVMAFGADTTYQWYLGGHKDAHQRFWRQMILYLAQKDEGDQPVWVKIDPEGKREFGQKDAVPIRFGARDDKGNPVRLPEYEIEVIGLPKRDDPQARHGYRFTVGGTAGENSRELKANPLPGEYWVRVTGKNKDQTPFGTGWERFLVEATDVELDNPAADRKLMQSIAEQSGGTHVPQVQEFAAFVERLTIPGDEMIGMERVTLWDTWPRLDEDGHRYVPGLLLLFVAVMSVEWFLRKRKGLV